VIIFLEWKAALVDCRAKRLDNSRGFSHKQVCKPWRSRLADDKPAWVVLVSLWNVCAWDVASHLFEEMFLQWISAQSFAEN
jgi:hypothetical protein